MMQTKETMVQLELGDMQGLIARGYGHLLSACYLLLKIEEAPAARAWLGALAEQVTPGDRRSDDSALHAAFTCEGLRALGMGEGALKTFSREFVEGMAAEHRSHRVLGDMGESAPTNWRWGGPNTEPVHALLLLFARDAEALEALCAQARTGYQGVAELARLDTHPFEPPQEHFGFSDGIAQPVVAGLSRSAPPSNTLQPGEFILGYENEYRKLPASPTVASGRDPRRLLPRVRTEGGEEAGDFGRNGSYLVFRQMSQDVQGFWQFVDEAASQLYGTSDHERRTRMAAKMVGRWPSGAPMALCPDRDDPAQSSRDDFGYRSRDAQGAFCPVGAHVRRTNPRDALEGTPEESITVANRHRLLRRGRPYGAPVSRTADVDKILEAGQEHEECGLHFICLNADIARQFEFVQHTWINNAKFGGLYSDADPLLGNHNGEHGTFTLQAEPVRRRVKGMKRFVEVRGGAYFFLPGLRALRYLASL